MAFSTPDIFLRHFLVFLSCERARNARNFQSNFFYLDYSVISAFILKCMFLIRLFPTDWRLITTWSNKLTSSVSVCQSLCTFISAGSKFAQLQCLWRTKDSNQVSALSWSLAIYTTLSECSCNTTQHNTTQPKPSVPVDESHVHALLQLPCIVLLRKDKQMISVWEVLVNPEDRVMVLSRPPLSLFVLINWAVFVC